MKKVQVGIDLGTTNTLVSTNRNGRIDIINIDGKKQMPSVLYVSEDGKEIIGKNALKKGKKDPLNCIRSSKTYIGKDEKWVIREKEYTPTDVAEKILRKVHDEVRRELELEEDDVVQAIITIPAYFTANQSDETKKAGERAGLEVLRIIVEPVAAAVAVSDELQDENIAVVDLGGGTFDVSILEVKDDKYKTIATGGSRELGGDTFDGYLVSYLKEVIQNETGRDLFDYEGSQMEYNEYWSVDTKIRQEAIKVKEELSDCSECEADCEELFDGYDLYKEITREEFDEICEELYEAIQDYIKKTMKDSDLSVADIGKVYLVGGSGRIPKVRKIVENFFGKKVSTEQDLDIQVAKGAGIMASDKSGFSVNSSQSKFQDIISHSMGIEVVGKKYSEILARGKEYPCEYEKIYSTMKDNQSRVIIKVYEKIDEDVSDDLKESDNFDFYGSFELKDITLKPKGQVKIKVKFDYDLSRTLHVTAYEEGKEDKKTTVVLHKGEIVEEVSDTQAKPMDFCVLMDASSSMSRDNRIQDAKKACHQLVDSILDLSVHRVSIITFDSFAKILCDLTNDAEKLGKIIDGLKTSGSTAMDAAIQNAIKELKNHGNSQNGRGIILITDGDPDHRKWTQEAAEAAKSQGIVIATIGVAEAEKAYLQKIASDENYCYMMENMAELAETFGKAVDDLLQA